MLVNVRGVFGKTEYVRPEGPRLDTRPSLPNDDDEQEEPDILE